MDDLLKSRKVSKQKKVPPDPGGVLRAISNSGYDINAALADLVDNSIDAGASNVLIRVFLSGNRVTQIAVADDGLGMTPDELELAMAVGKSSKGEGHLGLYGIGLKSASLSHARTLTVATRQGTETSAVEFAEADFADDWKLNLLDTASAVQIMDAGWPEFLNLSESGTVVIWSDLRVLGAEAPNQKQRYAQFARRAAESLGLVFHRYLAAGKIAIRIDLHDVGLQQDGIPKIVESLDPFPKVSADDGYPTTFHTNFAHGTKLNLKAYIWPPKSTSIEYKLGNQTAQRQGFYFYRNDRIIQAGGWNGWRNDSEPHLSLARVAVELPPAADSEFGLDMQKDGVQVPSEFGERITAAKAGNTTMADYVKTALDIYGGLGVNQDIRRATPSNGLDAKLRRQLGVILMRDGGTPIPVSIDSADMGDAEVFRVDHEGNKIILNSSLTTAGSSASSLESDIVRTLFFLLLAPDAIKKSW